jgi:hypothetical protein
MNIFETKIPVQPLGPVFREARMARKLDPLEVSRVTRLTLQEIESLEADLPLDPRRARLMAVAYLRFLGLNPTDFKSSLPALPELMGKRDMVAIRGENPIFQLLHSFLGMLAPMGRVALSLVILLTLLGTLGMIRQLSRVRSVPWITYSYSVPDSNR